MAVSAGQLRNSEWQNEVFNIPLQIRYS